MEEGQKKFKLKQPTSHAGDPCARQTANGNGGFACFDASLCCTAMACDVALPPQSMEPASLTGGSQIPKHVLKLPQMGKFACCCFVKITNLKGRVESCLPISKFSKCINIGNRYMSCITASLFQVQLVMRRYEMDGHRFYAYYFQCWYMRLGLLHEITSCWESSSWAKWEIHWDTLMCNDSQCFCGGLELSA